MQVTTNAMKHCCVSLWGWVGANGKEGLIQHLNIDMLSDTPIRSSRSVTTRFNKEYCRATVPYSSLWGWGNRIPESITQSVPSMTALATSVISALVGLGLLIMDSSIYVAVMTNLPAMLHLVIIHFCANATYMEFKVHVRCFVWVHAAIMGSTSVYVV